MKTLRLQTLSKPDTQRKTLVQGILARFPGGVPRPEYPRPHFVRPQWQCLNGAWEFAFDPYDQGLANRWMTLKLPDCIIVPFAPQAPLSGQNDQRPVPVAWYAREFSVPNAWRAPDTEILLHFGACDYEASVWVNGIDVGHNQGGHVPFSFNIAPAMKPGVNRVCVRACDPQDPHQPRGKQAASGVPSGCDYFCTTGIWQTVWLEPVPSVRVQDVRITPRLGENPAQDALEIDVYLHAPATGWRVRADVLNGLRPENSVDEDARPVIATAEVDAAGAVARLVIPLPHGQRWTPQTPTLYGVRVHLYRNGQGLDEVETYTGLRSTCVRGGKFLLNNNPLFLCMTLDQGYWPESLMTAPTDDALRADIEATLAFGYNASRKHQKVEDPRWLYWCDRLGLLVWGEMANARAWSPRAEDAFLAEWERAVRRDYNHPCLIMWVPINESWGLPGLQSGVDAHAQYGFLERVVTLTRRLDATRPIISNDGWEQAGVTDILSIHDYSATAGRLHRRYARAIAGGPLPPLAGESGRSVLARKVLFGGQPIMLTEVGGFLMPPDLPQAQWDELYKCYALSRTPAQLLAHYEGLMRGLSDLPFLAGFCYTQLTDIEQELNGLMTDTRRPKVPPEAIARLHHAYFGSPNWPRLDAWHQAQTLASRAAAGP